MSRFAVCLGPIVLLASCASVAPAPRMESVSTPTQYGDSTYERSRGPSEGTRVQGLIGITEITDSTVRMDPSIGEIQNEGWAQLPMIGGAFMQPLRGDRLKLGFEGGFTLGWQGDTGVVAVNNGTLLVYSDNDLFVLDAFVGAFGELFLGEHIRVYGGAGPLLQYGQVDIEYTENNNPVDITGSGFGGGVYARTGLELELSRGTLVGFGVRWLDSSVSLGSQLGKLDFQGIQFALTVTTGF